MAGILARAEVHIDAAADEVWAALVNPAMIKQYMFGSHVETDWNPGSPITWKGEYDGKSFEDKGEVLVLDPRRRLEVTHFSPFSGQPDSPENYHTLIYELTPDGERTCLSLSQDNNSSEDAAQHAAANWSAMLAGIKDLVEKA